MKSIVITGAASGIGRAFAVTLDDPMETDELWLIDCDREGLQEIGEKLKTPSRQFVIDLAKPEDLKSMEEALKREKPVITYLINCAGYGLIDWLENLETAAQLRMIDVNCRALTAMSFIVLPYLDKGSKIIQMSSGAAFMPQPHFAVYAASKVYVLYLSRAMNVQLKNRGITVTAVCPGPVRTAFYETACGNDTRMRKQIEKGNLMNVNRVVSKALKDVKRGKAVSYTSKSMCFAAILTKLMPWKLLLYFIMKESIRQYGYPDNSRI